MTGPSCRAASGAALQICSLVLGGAGMLCLTYVKHLEEMAAMLGIRLEPKLETRLNLLARQTGRTKSDLARQAIQKYLDEQHPSRVSDSELAEHLLAIGARVAALPVLDNTSADEEIPGYDRMLDPPAHR